MSDNFIKSKTKEDFDNVYMKALFSKIFDKLKGKQNSLLSFHEIMKHVKIKNEFYKGMQEVLIEQIVGSEGRYNDFNKRFLPRRKNLRGRWERVDEAHYKDIILPPIKLYKLSEMYFVRDGNHRVSVGKKQGRAYIDAEVVEIQTTIDNIKPGMTTEDLIKIVENHEREIFLETTELDQYRDTSKLRFTYTGRYNDIISHIHGHKYFMGIEKNCEIDFTCALLSWFDNLFIPIINEIENAKIVKKFPKRTSADLYVWIIRHWDELKTQYGIDIKISDAVQSYKKQYGKKNSFLNLFNKIFKGKKSEFFRRKTL